MNGERLGWSEPAGVADAAMRRPTRRWIGSSFARWAVASVAVLAVVFAILAVSHFDASGHPRAINAWGREYHRFTPCCEYGAHWGPGEITMSEIRELEANPIVVQLAAAPAGWLGATVNAGSDPGATELIFLQVGPDAYLPYSALPEP